jgi:transcriptional regulator with XRE-family HTH domain
VVARTTVDVVALHAALDAARESRNLSWRQLAREIEVSPSTMSRLANGLKPDVNAFAAMVRWLNLPAERFMIDPNEGNRVPHDQPDLVAELAPLLRARKDLTKEDVEHLEQIIGSAVRRFKAGRANPGG